MQNWMLFYLIGGFLMAALAWPMIRHKINPNGLAIFPPRGKLEDIELWYQANEYAGRRLLTVGIGTAMAALALYFWPGLALSEQDYIMTVTGVLMGLLLWAGITIYLFQKSL